MNTLFGIIVVAVPIYLLGGILITSPKRQAAAKREKERQRINREREALKLRQDCYHKERASLKPFPSPHSLQPYDGHVYLIREEHGQYKIGRSVDVPARFNTLKIQVPQKIALVWSIKCHDHKRVEKRLHRKYKPSRVRGEWFALTSEQVREITLFADGELG